MQFNLSEKKIQQFQDLIFAWFASHQRDLPWRQTHDAYPVLVSEVMLQQTQVDRVKKYWLGWIARWPTFEALAAAPTGEVIRAWGGLGYNRRAVNLQRAAQSIIQRGDFIHFTTAKELAKLPGIGPATAGALMNFVWNVDTPFLEVNLKRIFQRLAFGPETDGWASDRQLLAVAEVVWPAGQARVWPHALMDFGALACRPNDPLCADCPLGKLLPVGRLKRRARPRQIATGQLKPKFETTNRYWRGRIMDALRDHERLSADQILEKLPRPRLAPDRFQTLLTDLGRDGLLVQEGELVRLP